MNAVQTAWQTGNPVSKRGGRGVVKGFKTVDVSQETDALLAEGRLHEVEVPRNQRVNSAKTHFLVKLCPSEYDEFKKSGQRPHFEVPQSWRKPEIPSVPISSVP